jgi:hypothetical protein
MSPPNTLQGYLTEDDVRARLRPVEPLSKRTMALWRQQRKGPPYVQVGKTFFYPEDGLYAWLRTNTRQPVRERTRKSA